MSRELNCEDCELAYDCKSNKMEGIGPSKADIMIVVDAPGWTDDDDNEPLKGDTGAKFNYLIRQVPLKRSKVYITNAVKCKPWRMDKIKSKHVGACRKHLLKEILEVRPKIIVPMGKFALECVTGMKDIGDERGFFGTFEMDYPVKIGSERTTKTFSCKVLPTYSPYTCLTKWEFDGIVVHDLKKVVKFVETGKVPPPPKLTFEFADTLEKLNKMTEELANAESFSFDFETTGLSSHKHKIIMAGFCVKPGHAYIFPYHVYTDDEMKKKWTEEERNYVKKTLNPFVKKYKKQIHACLKRILTSKAKKTAHNGKFDFKFARSEDIRIVNWDFDSVMAHALIDENRPHNLIFVMDWFMPNNYGNYEKELWPYVNKTKATKKSYAHVPPMRLAYYLSMDVDIAKRLRPILYKRLKKEGFVDLLKKQQIPLMHLMADVEHRGVKIDVEQLQKLSKNFAGILAGIEKQLRKITKNPEFNPNSPAHVLQYFEEIGAPLEKKTAGGKFSTDADVLDMLASKKRWAKVPKLLLEHRAITKLKGTYLDGKSGDEGILSWIDDKYKVHANWNAHTPRTGRMSCEDPPLQTIPRPNPKYPEANIRQLFIPSRKDWVIFSIDYKQIEMRIAAYLSRDPVMMKEIRDGVDIHSRNAVMFGTKLGTLPSDMTEDKFISIVKWKCPEGRDLTEEEKQMKQLSAEYQELRNLAKSLGFGLNYGMEASTLAKEYSVEEEMVQDMIDLYFRKYQGLALWRDEMKALSLSKGVLVLPETGRKRRFTDAAKWFADPGSKLCRKREMDMQSVYRQAMNYPIQGYANEVFTQGKLKFYAAMKKEKMKSHIMMSLHDGVLGEGPMEEMKKIKRLAYLNLERKLAEGKKHEVHLGIDFELYDRWNGKKLVLAA